MSRLIDADRLLKRTKFYNLPNGNRAIDEIDILHAPTVQAIPLDKVKKAREEIQEYSNETSDRKQYIAFKSCLALLDELIESEDKE